jgi:hypothetical protein
LAANFYPFDSAVANDLVAQWQDNIAHQPKLSVRELITRVSACAITDPQESDCLLLGLQPHQIFKRRAFIRHFRSSHTYVWKRALTVCLPNRVEQIMDGVEGVLLSADKNSVKSGKQTRLDILLYDEIIDNFNEDGFLSVALQVVQRILGDVEKHPDNLVFSVNYADHLERKYQLFQEQLTISSGS